MNMLASLRVRLVLWTVTLQGALFLAFALYLLTQIQQLRVDQIDENLHLTASQLSGLLERENDGTFSIPSSALPDLQSLGASAWLIDANNNVSFTLGAGQFTPPPVYGALNQPMDVELEEEIAGIDDDIRTLATSLELEDGTTGVLIVALNREASEAFLAQVATRLVSMIPLIMILYAGIGWILANRALAPVSKITQTARNINAAKLNQRLDMEHLPDDEIGQLARTFDAMLDRLDEAFRRERQFTSDASHELRTPLGMMKMQLSLARSRPRDKDELLTMMSEMEADVDRMTRLVEQMLTMTRQEEGAGVPHSVVDCAALLQDTVSQYQRAATERGVTLSTQLPDDLKLQVKGNAAQLQIVFSNLLDNAIKYTDSGGSVTVRAIHDGSQCIVEIADTGVGIPAEHLSHLFERFYRVDAARTRESGGFGLGLSLVKAASEAHNGDITVNSVPGEGTTFTVKLPASA